MNNLPLRDMIAVAFFAALTTVGAWISFPLPFSPVPIVLANFIAVLAGVILGSRLGALSQVVYLLMGVVGMPVFAKFTAGPGVLFGATGGYLFGYLLAAFTAGLLMEYLPRMPQVARLSIALTMGMIIVYLPGIPWLAHVAGFDISTALVKGLYPYLPGDVVKIIIGVTLCLSLAAQLPQIWGSDAGKKPADQAETG
ncbi:MAG: biotin transporter BioY [Thermoleophilia bacterium]